MTIRASAILTLSLSLSEIIRYYCFLIIDKTMRFFRYSVTFSQIIGIPDLELFRIMLVEIADRYAHVFEVITGYVHDLIDIDRIIVVILRIVFFMPVITFEKDEFFMTLADI